MHDRGRETSVQFLNGKTIAVKTPYMLRKRKPRRGRRRKRGKRGVGGAGIYPVLKMLGIIAGASPALSERAVLGVLNNTFAEAEEALRREGVAISVKRLRTVSLNFSRAALHERSKSVEALESGKIKSGDSLKNKRVVITIDGGRIRTRLAKRGCRKGFHTDWKEPKLFTIYEIEDDGRKRKKGFISCDGTIDGPEALIRLLATELVMHGASEAEKLMVIADGATWIWNHIDELLKLAGIDPAKVTRILDFYHAVEHLKAISEILYRSQSKQSKWFNKIRRMLKERAPKVFMAELAKSIGRSGNKELTREKNYFMSNIASINYRIFKRMKMPIGSGVIESTIRRVVNLRLKGAGMFWLKENAEGLLHLRCQLKSGNWNTFYKSTIEKLASLE
jgi:hypothetical protein